MGGSLLWGEIGSCDMWGRVGDKVFGLFKEYCEVGGVWFKECPSGGLTVYRAFSG